MQLLILLVAICASVCLGETVTIISRPRKGSVKLSTRTSDELFDDLPALLRHAYRSNTGIFPYYDTAVAAQSGGFIPDFDITDVSTSKLLNPPDGTFIYYSGNLMHESFRKLRKKMDIQKVIKNIMLEPSIVARISPNVWIGGAGVKASMHYDSVHNVYIHYAGVKTIRLLPPSAIHVLSMHGRMHPYACQSRINDTTTGERFPRAPYCITHDCTVTNVDDRQDATTATCMNSEEYVAYYNQHVVEYTLHPGDVLVIPPFWFHEVHTHTPAISVSLWWDAAELDTMDQIFALPLPFEGNWSANYTVTAAQMFVTMLVEAVESEVYVYLSHVQSGAASSARRDHDEDIDIDIDIDVDIDDLTSQFSMNSLLRLLKTRYEDDWQYRNNGPSTYTHERVPVEHNTTLITHMQAAALTRARVFTAGFLSDHNFINSNSIELEFADNDHPTVTEGAVGTCTAAADAQVGECVLSAHQGEASQQYQTILESQLAVLSIKLCDYIEDVFHHVAGVVVTAQSQRNDVHLVARNAVAVDLLLEWVSLF